MKDSIFVQKCPLLQIVIIVPILKQCLRECITLVNTDGFRHLFQLCGSWQELHILARCRLGLPHGELDRELVDSLSLFLVPAAPAFVGLCLGTSAKEEAIGFRCVFDHYGSLEISRAAFDSHDFEGVADCLAAFHFFFFCIGLKC